MAIDLTDTNPSARFTLISNTLHIPPIVTTLMYDPTWAFDSSTKITICSGENGGLQANCIVQNLKVSFKIPIQFVTMPFSNVPNLIGDYKIDEGRGGSLTNSQTGARSLANIPLSKIFTLIICLITNLF